MAAVNTLSSMKKMKRSLKMRDSNISDEELVSLMEEMMNEAIIAQASGNTKMMKRSLGELRQVRKDVRVGKVNVSGSGKQAGMVGRFSNVIDQLEGEQETVKQEMGGGSGGIGGLAKNLPSAETFISAIMTSNPLLGYSAKILKDIGGSVKSKGQADKELKRRQAQILEEQKEYVLGRKEELEMESEINDQQANQITEYDQILERIENELIKLRMLWGGEDTALVQESQETNNNLNELVQAEERLADEQRLQRERSEFSDIEQQREGDGDIGGLVSGEDGEDGGFFGILAGLAGLITGGIMTGITAVFGFLSSIGRVGLSLLKIGMKGSIIGAVIMAIYDFIDGFFNAGDILDMDEADLNIKDKIIAGFASIWGNIIKLFDTVLEWFGVDLINSENITETIAKKTKKLVDGFFDWVFGLFDNVKQFIEGFDIGDTITMIKEKSIEFMQNLIDIIPDMVSDAFSKVGETFDNVDDWLHTEIGGDEDAKATGDGDQSQGFKSDDMSFGGNSSSATMTNAVNNFEESSSRADNNSGASSAVVTGNGNTTVNNNNTQVTPVGNTSNLDDTIRDNDRREMINRMRR
jgi:hypothetical protein